MIGNADIEKAVQVVWENHLHSLFQAFWGSDTEHESLEDDEAEPGHPHPYCVYELRSQSTISRMTSAASTGRREIRNVPLAFKIHSKQLSSSSLSSKQLAADLAAEVMGIYGGHPTVVPKTLTLDNGCVLQLQYQNDFGLKTGDTEHVWQIDYIVTADVPVAA